MISRRALSASSNLTPPVIALVVHAATASPAPRCAASSSSPSSTHTVLSTSKQTASALRQTSTALAAGDLSRQDILTFLLVPRLAVRCRPRGVEFARCAMPMRIPFGSVLHHRPHPLLQGIDPSVEILPPRYRLIHRDLWIERKEGEEKESLGAVGSMEAVAWRFVR
eukprot:scaffold932_cov328-Pavlova_lutheri.AAC.27